MTTKECWYCKKDFIGEGDICNNCKLAGKENIEKMAKLIATVETYAALRNMKDSRE